MKQYIKTSSYYFFFEEDISQRPNASDNLIDGIGTRIDWRVKVSSLEEGLKGLSKYCNENNFEIKSLMPIERAQSAEYRQMYTDRDASYNTTTMAGYGWGYGWGLGHGWGITMTDGFAAMLQSIEMLSDEEYEKRVAEDKRLEEARIAKEKQVQALTDAQEKINKKITEQKEKIQDNKDQIKQWNANIQHNIVEKIKGLLKKRTVYLVGKREFPERALAQDYMDETLAKVSVLKKETEQLKEEHDAAKKEFDSLSNQLSEL